MVCLQGAPMGAYRLYVSFGATLKAGQKTSKAVDLFFSEALKPKHQGRFQEKVANNGIVSVGKKPPHHMPDDRARRKEIFNDKNAILIYIRVWFDFVVVRHPCRCRRKFSNFL